MNLPVDPNDLPPPTAEEATARRHEIDVVARRQRSKRLRPWWIGGGALAVVWVVGLDAAASGDNEKSLSPAQDEVRRLDIVWETKPDIRQSMCEIYISLGQYGDSTGELAKGFDAFKTPEAAARLQVLVERDC